MKKLIELDAAIEAMMKLQTEDIEAYGASIPEGFDGDRAVAALKALPSVDAVPVVRCRPMQLVPDDGFCDKGKGR